MVDVGTVHEIHIGQNREGQGVWIQRANRRAQRQYVNAMCTGSVEIAQPTHMGHRRTEV